jgi:hypothetical protein
VVETVSIWEKPGVKIIVVEVAESVWEGLPLSRVVRRTRSRNAEAGINGLIVNHFHLRVRFDDLFNMMEAYAKAYGGKAS